MPWFLASLLGGLISIVGTLVGRVLVSLGLTLVTYTGVDTSISWAKAFVVTKIEALPANAVAIAGVMQVGTCISILTSALAARLVMQGLTSGTVKRWVTG